MEAGLITVERQRGPFWTDQLRAYKVVIDGEVVGRLRQGDVGHHVVPPGTHRLRLKIDRGGSRTVDVDVAPGSNARFVCRPSLRGWQIFKPWGMWRRLTTRRHSWVELEPASTHSIESAR